MPLCDGKHAFSPNWVAQTRRQQMMVLWCRPLQCNTCFAENLVCWAVPKQADTCWECPQAAALSVLSFPTWWISLPVPFPHLSSLASGHVSSFLPTMPRPRNSHGFYMFLSLMRASPPQAILYLKFFIHRSFITVSKNDLEDSNYWWLQLHVTSEQGRGRRNMVGDDHLL